MKKEENERLNMIVRLLSTISKQLERKPSLDIPPLWVRKASLKHAKLPNWEHSYRILCDYYAIPHLFAKVDPKEVPVSGIACYSSENRTIYSRDKIMTDKTGIHEFAHYLFDCLGIQYSRVSSEVMTEAYVEAFLEGV